MFFFSARLVVMSPLRSAQNVRPREAQKSPGRPKDAQVGPARPREAQRGPGRPRDAHRGPGRPRETQRGPVRPKELHRSPGENQNKQWLLSWRRARRRRRMRRFGNVSVVCVIVWLCVLIVSFSGCCLIVGSLRNVSVCFVWVSVGCLGDCCR